MGVKPLVSVVVATYRRNESLYIALQSIVNQTFNNVEIIVVDDNDDENWNSIVRDITSSFVRQGITIKLIVNHPNLGSARARNAGIKNSSGKYVTFLDDDDKYLPKKIEMQLMKMEEDDSDYSLTDLTLLNEDGSLSERRSREYLLSNEKENLFLCHLKYHMTGTDTMMFKKDYLIEIGMFEPIDVGDEFYLMSKAIRNKGKFSYLPESFVEAYVHTGDAGLSSGESKINGENALFEYKKKYFGDICKNDRNYIRMRHHAVLAFAYKRNGSLAKFLSEGVISFISSPIDCIRLITNLK